MVSAALFCVAPVCAARMPAVAAADTAKPMGTHSNRGAWPTRLLVFCVGSLLSCAAFYWVSSTENRHVL